MSLNVVRQEVKTFQIYPIASNLYPEKRGTMFPRNGGVLLQTSKTLHHTTWILHKRFSRGFLFETAIGIEVGLIQDKANSVYDKIKKQSLCRPGQAHRVPGGTDSKISWQQAREGGNVVSPTHRPPLPPRKYYWYSFLLEAESPPGPQCGQKDYVNIYLTSQSMYIC
jgi:hypothetical protein